MATHIAQNDTDLANDPVINVTPSQLKVYIVIGRVRYEFEKIEGVYINSEAAKARVKEVKKIRMPLTKTNLYDDVHIEEYDVHGAKGWV